MSLPHKGQFYYKREVYMDDKNRPTKAGRLKPLDD